MKNLRDMLQHHLNPLHVYCRLRSIGMNGPMARKVSNCYERLVYQHTALVVGGKSQPILNSRMASTCSAPDLPGQYQVIVS